MDPAFLTIAELGRLYDQRELSPVEVTRSLLDRVAAHDAKLHSFIRVTPEAALAEAQAAERELMAGRRRGPLHGIPYALKDIVETAGIQTTGHSKLCKDYVPAADAHLVTLLKAGGAVLMGKLATWEFALGGPSWDLPWPPARNPWNPDYLPGGSSSGASAAVAAGFVPGAVGTDTGGSIRGPAAVCGIAGLKPTYGRVSRRGVFPNTFTMDHCGPLTRSTGDIALFLQVIAGFDAEDPGSEDVPVPDYRAALTGRIEGLRFGVDRALVCPGRPPRPCAGDLGRGRGLARARRGGRAGAIVEPARLHRLQDDDLDRRALLDPREGPEDAATGFRPDPAQPRIAGCLDPRRGIYAGAALARRIGPRAGADAEAIRRAADCRCAQCRRPRRPEPAGPACQLAQHHNAVQRRRVAGTRHPVRVQPRRRVAVVIADRRGADGRADRAAHRPCLPAGDRLASSPSRSSLNREEIMRTDLSHLPPSTPDEIRVMTRRAGLDLPEELMQQFIAVWPAFEAMVRRIPRDLGRAAEPAHSYRPLRIVRG